MDRRINKCFGIYKKRKKKMTEGQLKSLAHSIKGVTCEDDCFVLYDIARKTQVEGDILEIGNFKGRVTVYCQGSGGKQAGENL